MVIVRSSASTIVDIRAADQATERLAQVVGYVKTGLRSAVAKVSMPRAPTPVTATSLPSGDTASHRD